MRKLLIFLAIPSLTIAQDIHFSSYYALQPEINPALAGFMEGLYRGKVFYRNQWGNVPVPYNTAGLTLDGRFFVSGLRDAWIGTAISFYSDQAGDLKFGERYISIMSSYTHSLDGENYFLGVGLALSYFWRTVDIANATTNSQWDGFQYNPDLPINEPDFGPVSAPNLSAGVFWAGKMDNFQLIIAGSLHNLIKPNVAFITKEQRSIRTTVYSLARIYISRQFSLLPMITINYQKPASEYIVGLQFAYDLNPQWYSVNILYAGVLMRVNDAITPVVRYRFKSIELSLAYDITISELGSYAGRNAGPEAILSVMYPFDLPRRGVGSLSCPRF